jgi:predicted MFS family arabinose efflux permease
MLTRSTVRIGILAFAHFTVDFYYGLGIPLPEPTLVRHLSVDLLAVMAILSTSAIIVDAIQPLGGLLLPKQGLPSILVAGPLLAAATVCIGLTTNYWGVAALLMTGAVGIGIVHNEAVLTVQGLTKQRLGLAVSVFMSGGYFGAASGALISGWWAQNSALRYFWVWGGLSVLLVGLVIASGLHRLRPGGGHSRMETEEGGVAFAPLLALAICIATANVILVRLMPVFLVRTFGEQAQVWGGAVFFAVGMAGAFGSYAWGYLSARFGSGALIVAAWLVGIPFLYLLFHPHEPRMVLLWRGRDAVDH